MTEITPRAMIAVLKRAADAETQQRVAENHLPECGPIAVASARSCFDDRQDYEGNPWPPLKFPRPGETDLGQPLLDKGVLRASITTRVEGSALILYTNRIGARLLHYGGIVVPVNAKFLCIPATVEAKRAGSPRDFPGLLVPKIKGGETGVMLGVVGLDVRPRAVELDQLTVQYIMTKKVTILSRRFLGYSKEAADDILWSVGERVIVFVVTGIV